MTAKGGPHYASNVRMDGSGQYKLTCHVIPEASRHTDQATGLPAWWPSFSETFTFTCPQK